MKKKIIALVCAFALAMSNAAVLAAEAEPETRYVLSGNSFTDADKTLYSDTYGINLVSYATDASYRWDAATQTKAETSLAAGGSSMKTGDWQHKDGVTTIYNEMVGGSIINTTNISNFSAGTVYAGGTTATADFDLGAVYSVNGVDVWSIDAITSLSSRIGSVEIWTGETADNMKMVWSGDAAPDLTLEAYNDSTVTWSNIPVANHSRTAAAFNAVDARFVRIKMTRGTGKSGWGDAAQMIIGELVIFGNLPADETNAEVVKARYKAEKALESANYYTDASVAELKAKLNAMENDNAQAAEVIAAINALSVKEDLTYHIVSGNNLSNSDDTTNLYPNWSVGAYETLPALLGNSVTYEYEANGNAVKDNDVDNGGVRLINTADVWSTWYKGPSTAIFDLGEICAVNRVDIIETIGSNNGIKYAEVYVSDDGASFEKVPYTLTKSDAYSSKYLWKFDFPITETRYVIVSVTSTGYKPQHVIDEVVMFGYEQLMDVSFGETQYEIKNAENASIDTLEGAVSVAASGSLVNNTTADITGNVYTAIYDGEGSLVAVAIESGVTVPASDTKTAAWSASIETDSPLGADAKLVNFFWKTDLTPLAKPQEK